MPLEKKEMTIEDHLSNIKKHTVQSKIIRAVNILKNASCEMEVLDAVSLKEEVNWLEVDDQLKDQWYEYLGNAQVYLP